MTSSNIFQENDYDAWADDHFEWPSVSSFIDAESWADGIHTVEMDGGPSLDLLFKRRPLQSNVVPVFFNGAIAGREEKTGPFFSGQRIADSVGFGFIAISDPSTNLHESLGLAWYAGNQYGSLQTNLTRILTAIAESSNSELLFVGGSGGGYASLYYGHELGKLASVLVWNPQTDILRYNAQFVKNYLRHAFSLELPEYGWEDLVDLSDSGVALNIRSSRPRRLLYMQNASDWHVAIHASPFLKRESYNGFGDGRFSTDSEHIVFIADYGEGHSPLPEGVLKDALSSMLDPDTSAWVTSNVVIEKHKTGISGLDETSEGLSKCLGDAFNRYQLA